MLRLAVALACLLSVAERGTAQVNTERLRTPLDSNGVALTVEASAAFATGNTDYLQIGAGGRADGRLGRTTGFLVGRLDLGRTDETSFVDRSFGHARLTTPLRGRFSAEGFGQVERNRQQRLDSRLLLGAGLRAALAEADSFALALGVTPMLEIEKLDADHGGTQADVVRISTYLSGRGRVASGARLSAVVYAQPRADAPGDLRLLAQSALDVQLSDVVALSVRLTLRHDTRPPGDLEQTDLWLENGLVVTLPPN